MALLMTYSLHFENTNLENENFILQAASFFSYTNFSVGPVT